MLTLKSRATAIPRADEIEVELCPAPKGSYSLSALFVKPACMNELLICICYTHGMHQFWQIAW